MLMKVFLWTHPIIDFDKSAFQNKINNISKIVYKIEVESGKLKRKNSIELVSIVLTMNLQPKKDFILESRKYYFAVNGEA